MLETIRLRMKALFELICFGKSFQSFPNLIGGISHFTPLPMGEGTGEGLLGCWLLGFYYFFLHSIYPAPAIAKSKITIAM